MQALINHYQLQIKHFLLTEKHTLKRIIQELSMANAKILRSVILSKYKKAGTIMQHQR